MKFSAPAWNRGSRKWRTLPRETLSYIRIGCCKSESILAFTPGFRISRPLRLLRQVYILCHVIENPVSSHGMEGEKIIIQESIITNCSDKDENEPSHHLIEREREKRNAFQNNQQPTRADFFNTTVYKNNLPSLFAIQKGMNIHYRHLPDKLFIWLFDFHRPSPQRYEPFVLALHIDSIKVGMENQFRYILWFFNFLFSQSLWSTLHSSGKNNDLASIVTFRKLSFCRFLVSMMREIQKTVGSGMKRLKDVLFSGAFILQ